MMSGINLVVLVVLFGIILFIVGTLLVYNWGPNVEEIGIKDAFYQGCAELRTKGCGSLSEVKTEKGDLRFLCEQIYGNDVDNSVCRKACGCPP